MGNINQTLLNQVLTERVKFESDELANALDAFSFHCFDSQAMIFGQGDLVTDVHFVLAGLGRYFYIDNEGNERVKSFVRQGGAFASISTLVESRPSPFYTQALSRCVTASIDYQALIELSRRSFNWASFIRIVYERLALKKEQREADFLLLTAKQRYIKFIEGFGQDAEHIPLRQIAMYIGITDVSLSRIRREMGLT